MNPHLQFHHALPELCDLTFDSADPHLPGAPAIAVALGDAGSSWAAPVRFSTCKFIMQLATYPIISL
jgi:hypothetical protein